MTTRSLREKTARLAMRLLVGVPMRPGVPLPILRRGGDLLASVSPLPHGTTIDEDRLAGVPCEIVRHARSRDDHAVLYLHGGGYTIGSPRTHRPITTRLARDVAATVVAPRYRLAPEHPHPAALDDVVEVYERLLRDRPSRLTLAGDSAGGGLALVLGTVIVDAGLRRPDAIAVISPWGDLTNPPGSLDTAEDPLIRRPFGDWCADSYAHGRLDDPRCSPLFADLTGLPPLMIQVGGAEALLDDAHRLAAAATEAGVDVELQVCEAMWHDHQLAAGFLPAADRAIADLARFLRRSDPIVSA